MRALETLERREFNNDVVVRHYIDWRFEDWGVVHHASSGHTLPYKYTAAQLKEKRARSQEIFDNLTRDRDLSWAYTVPSQTADPADPVEEWNVIELNQRRPIAELRAWLAKFL